MNKVRGTNSTTFHRSRLGPRAIQHPVFLRILGVSLSAHLVRFIDFTLVAWLLVQKTDSSMAVGSLVFFRVIPFLIFGPFVGALLDRYPRITLFRLTQLGMAFLSFAFAVLVYTGYASLPVIFAYSTFVGAMMMIEISSRKAYVSGVVGPAILGSAIALDMALLNAAWFIGSALGGVVAELIDTFWAYIFIGIVLVTNFLLLRRLPKMLRPDLYSSSGSALKLLRDGYFFARRNPVIFAALLVVGVNNFFGYPFESMAPAFADDIYGAGPMAFGLLMSAQGLGSMITAGYIALRGRRLRNPGLLLISASLLQGIGNIGFSYTDSLGIGFLAITGLGLISMVFGITHATLILLVAPLNLRGRIMGFQMLMMGLYPIGSMALGVFGDLVGLQQAVRFFAISGILLLLLIWFKYPQLRKPFT